MRRIPWRGRRLAVTIALLALAAVPAVAFAGLPRTPAPPRAGVWRTTNSRGSVDDFAGTFVVTAGHELTGLHGRIQRGAVRACGRGTVTVGAGERIADAKGVSPSGGPYNMWVVGVNAPRSMQTVRPINVTLTHDGQRVRGAIEVEFTPGHSMGIADLFYDRNRCELQFNVARG